MGSFVAFGGYLAYLYGTAIFFSSIIFKYYTASAALERVFSFFDILPENINNNRVFLKSIKQYISFKNIYFSYNNNDKYVLEDVFFRIDIFSLRERIGLVNQESFLFDDTIRNNIIYSNPQASVNEFYDVCKRAQVLEFTEKFPQVLDTKIGERDVKLSIG